MHKILMTILIILFSFSASSSSSPLSYKAYLMHPKSTVEIFQVEALTHLHPNDGVDEEQHGNEEADIWQRLRRDT